VVATSQWLLLASTQRTRRRSGRRLGSGPSGPVHHPTGREEWRAAPFLRSPSVVVGPNTPGAKGAMKGGRGAAPARRSCGRGSRTARVRVRRWGGAGHGPRRGQPTSARQQQHAPTPRPSARQNLVRALGRRSRSPRGRRTTRDPGRCRRRKPTEPARSPPNRPRRLVRDPMDSQCRHHVIGV
jgi:hypothetical protein